jgi:hypothetical protein
MAVGIFTSKPIRYPNCLTFLPSLSLFEAFSEAQRPRSNFSHFSLQILTFEPFCQAQRGDIQLFSLFCPASLFLKQFAERSDPMSKFSCFPVQLLIF